MLESINLISCNFSRLPLLLLKPSRPHQSLRQSPKHLLLLQSRASSSSTFLKSDKILHHSHRFSRKDTFFHICKSSLNNPEEPEKTQIQEEGRDWSSSILLFALWGALLYYCFNLAPDQTPVRIFTYLLVQFRKCVVFAIIILGFSLQTQDLYFLKKLLNLKGDDGFRMNQILVGLWYIMGLWPLVYGMLLLPTARRYHFHGFFHCPL